MNPKNHNILLYISYFILLSGILIGIGLYYNKKKLEIINSQNTNKENNNNIKIQINQNKNINIKQSSDLNWKPEGNKIKTKWGENLNPEKVWQEYPRPQLERKEWTNLNGLWDYYITNQGLEKHGEEPDGKILVPFPIESSLSGVMKNITENQTLWYEINIQINKKWKNNGHLLLHFEAVDYFSEVFINDKKVGEHKGGYTPFYFDIKDFIDFKQFYFKITVKVIDPTEKGYQAIGKQNSVPHGMFYTSTTGIWQTVWIESVNNLFIKKLNIETNFDKKEIIINPRLNINDTLPVSIIIKYNETIIYNNDNYDNQKSNTNITIPIKNKYFYPWSPDEPNLYNIEISLKDKESNKTLDEIKSYTAIRKISKGRDKNRILRFKLNNKFIFPIGTLDQGFFPDGIYTPPSDEAQIYDIKTLKEMGFNTIRKHVKVENSRYYYHCDKIGMMIWQDMPSSDYAGENNTFGNWNKNWNATHFEKGLDTKRNKKSRKNFYNEWKSIINYTKFFQSIVLWIPFNEAWGQFNTETVASFTKEKDPSRLITAASGGNHWVCGDVLDIHYYPEPIYYLKHKDLINVYGEYGGIGLYLKEHMWSEKNMAYYSVNNTEELTQAYFQLTHELFKLIKEGISGGIYTQTTDVEDEINGLITYDRKVVKVDKNEIKKINEVLRKRLDMYNP